MDSELIEKVLRKDFGLTCPHCKTNIDFQYTLLINCPKGFLHLNTGLKLEEIIRQLLEFEIIDIQGNIISPLLHSSKTQNTAVNLKEATDKDIAAIIQRYNSWLLFNNPIQYLKHNFK